MWSLSVRSTFPTSIEVRLSGLLTSYTYERVCVVSIIRRCDAWEGATHTGQGHETFALSSQNGVSELRFASAKTEVKGTVFPTSSGTVPILLAWDVSLSVLCILREELSYEGQYNSYVY